MKKLFISITLLVVLAACKTTPMGRKQLSLMPDGKMNAMGSDAFNEMKSKSTLETDPKINAYVKCVAGAVAKEASGEATGVGVNEWEIVVFKDNTANAFALPGGKIGVHTGILPMAKTPGQLAAVLGHEVGHVIARHGNERVSQQMAMQGGLTALGIGGVDKNKMTALMGAATVGVILPFSRGNETEADRIGQTLMAKAGFDPHEAADLWKNMGAGGGKQPPQFMSTHPSNDSRISDLNNGAEPNMQHYNNAKAAGKNPNCKL